MGIYVSIIWVAISIAIVYAMAKYIVDNEIKKRGIKDDDSEYSEDSSYSIFLSEESKKIIQDYEKSKRENKGQ